MSGYVSAAALAVAAVGTGYSIYSGEKAADAQADAQKQAKKQAEATATAAEQATNAANKKKPDTNAILSAAMQASKAGVSGTMLTGSKGVSNSQLTLGKSSLLGG